MKDFKALPSFRGVDLLTLSACNTGVGETSGDGREVESFGVLAQRNGAKAVIATLWSVADDSTSQLMHEFYRLRQQSPGLLKSEALRQAQLALLHRAIRPAGHAAAGRGVKVRSDGAAAAPADDYTNPYYWAPFFLIGNWL